MTESARARRWRQRREHYRRHRAEVGERLLRAVLRAEGTLDATASVNRQMEAEGLGDLGLRLEDVRHLVEMVLRAEALAIVARSAFLPHSAQQALVERTVARLLPRRDDAPPSSPRRVEAARHADLQSRLLTEARRLGGDERKGDRK